jgi:hypothetical protein
MRLNRRNSVAVIALYTFAALLVAEEPPTDDSPSKAVLRKSFLGQTPPEIVSEKSHWLGPPPYTKLEQLHGNVVWLQFNF